jgi:hypothetical protein
MTSSSVSDHGNPAGITVLTQKGIIFKEMEAHKNVDKWLNLGDEFRELLGSTSHFLMKSTIFWDVIPYSLVEVY